MSELEKEALDEIAKPKKRGRKKKNTNLITGDIAAVRRFIKRDSKRVHGHPGSHF